MQMETLYIPGCVRTFTGQFIKINEPDPLMIFPVDIAVGLSRAMRFAGHTKKPYSVAEHSVWCMLKAEELYPQDSYLPFKILLHDAHEYLLCDVPTPVKKLLPEYDLYTTILQDAIHERFKVAVAARDAQRIAEIDKLALEWEWGNIVLKWAALGLDDKSRIDYFIHHFTRLCKTPVVLQP